MKAVDGVAEMRKVNKGGKEFFEHLPNLFFEHFEDSFKEHTTSTCRKSIYPLAFWIQGIVSRRRDQAEASLP